MMIQDPAPLSRNVPEYTVSELSTALKRVVEKNFEHVRLRGELSGVKRHTSGHVYMNLKDADAVINGVCWRGVAGHLAVQPEDGLEVIVTGKITTYGARSSYQIVIEKMEMAGEGAILKMLEERKKRLAAEGLFDPARKRPLPYLPDLIGVVTSPTGAVIQDIYTTIERRFPRPLLLAGVKVQGAGAAAEIAAAILGFSSLPAARRPDVLIVARGGGSLEDLLPFSEEIVVRAVAASVIPVISSVGHETDTMLIDYVADRRAPTPTAAAEMAVPVRDEVMAFVYDQNRRLGMSAKKLLRHRWEQVQGLARGLISPQMIVQGMQQRLHAAQHRLQQSVATFLTLRVHRIPVRLRSPRDILNAKQQRLDGLVRFMTPRTHQRLERDTTRLTALARLLDSFSYKNVLARGFALVRGADGRWLTSAAATKGQHRVTLVFGDGDRAAELTDKQ